MQFYSLDIRNGNEDPEAYLQPLQTCIMEIKMREIATPKSKF